MPQAGVTTNVAALTAVVNEVVGDFSTVGEYLLRFDMDSLRHCPYAVGHVTLMASFEEKVPKPLAGGGESLEVSICPRTILKKIVRETKENLGVEFIVGFESEFVLLSSTNPPCAVNSGGWCMASSFDTGKQGQQVLDEIAEAVQGSGIELQMFHAEAALGQYEIVTGPLPPLEAVDALVQTRQIIFNIACKHGLRATFAPHFNLDGTACHTHISPHTRSAVQEPSTTSPHLDHLQSTFLAGLLDHLHSVQAYTQPLSPSYKRVRDGVWSGGSWIAWGVDNRDCPIRLCNARLPRSRNFEVRCVDGLANPYLSLAAIIAAGVLGVKHRKESGMLDCSGDKTPGDMSEAERQERGITRRMALTREEARDSLMNDESMKEVMGKDGVEAFLAVNEVAEGVFSRGTERDQAKRLVESF
ncbi:glutamine synthetase guanido kinase [Coniophora puteana RWD-64-598 SS2]|uniref:Glutamine synthetase guanido kinase n=1 Tax=Coniophora puteana (strain RWD-64-598) TaxID=741705 RepID=A0A5M3MP25_CONPW|nr:glutamine synthetase guanido kinase [Coniophora puteana RWD-64-598 SS2]EIW80776.1 glutamine synthetase guanido kinase [Coniophora puteana RWD-64-598 SS2]